MPCPYFRKRKHFWSHDVCLEQGEGMPLDREAGGKLCQTEKFHTCRYYLKSDAAKEHARQEKKELEDRRRGR